MTLLEVLVAFVIAAMALGAFYEGAVGGLANARTAGSYEEAVSLARSHLAELTQRQNARPLEAEGSDGKLFHYSIRVTQIAQEQLSRSLLEEANNRQARSAGLYALSVTESWTEGGHQRRVQLLGETMSAGPAAR